MKRWGDLDIRVGPGDSLIVDGVKLPVDIIPELLYTLAHPDPRKWYRFERVDDLVIAHVKITEEKPNGSVIGITSKQDSRKQGPEASRA